MRGISLRKKRQALFGWVKWLPVIGAPFVILLGDTWLNICMWQSDYAYRQIERQLRTVQAQLAQVTAQAAEMQDVHKLNELALTLAMVEPSPDQIKSLHGVLPSILEPEDLPQEAVLTIASLEQGAEQAAALVEHIADSGVPGAVAETLSSQLEAVVGAAAPVQQWVQQEITPAIESIQQLAAPEADTVLGAAKEVGAAVNAIPPVAEQLGSLVESAAPLAEIETLEQLATFSETVQAVLPRPAAPAAAPAPEPAPRPDRPVQAVSPENDPSSLLESL